MKINPVLCAVLLVTLSVAVAVPVTEEEVDPLVTTTPVIEVSTTEASSGFRKMMKNVGDSIRQQFSGFKNFVRGSKSDDPTSTTTTEAPEMTNTGSSSTIEEDSGRIVYPEDDVQEVTTEEGLDNRFLFDAPSIRCPPGEMRNGGRGQCRKIL